MKKLLLSLIAVLVVAPTLLLVIVGTIYSPLLVPLCGPLMAFALLGAWFGVAALVRLITHFSQSESLPPSPRKIVVGLLLGVASALSLMGSSAGPLRYPTVLLLLAPVAAAAILGYLLWRSWRAV